MKIAPSLLDKQNDWEDILHNSALSDPALIGDLSFSEYEHIKKCKQLSSIYKGKLAQIWFDDAVSGSPIFYPSNDQELNYYSVRKSSVYNFCLDMWVALIMLAPLWEDIPCIASKSGPSSVSVVSGIFVLLAVTMQAVDLWLFYKSSHWDGKYTLKNALNGDYSGHWQLARYIAIVVMLVYSLAYVLNARLFNLSRMFVPLLLISRRDDFKQIFEGVVVALKKSFKVTRVIIAVVVLWAFAGLCLFRRYNGEGKDYFSNFGYSLFTTLHCMISRPSVLYRINPIFEENLYSPLFFVTLTLVGDIVCIALIIAIGTRNFRDFSSENFKRRLKYRQLALRAIFSLYCEDTKHALSLPRWIHFCRHLGLCDPVFIVADSLFAY
jgi:hypothetical protein